MQGGYDSVKKMNLVVISLIAVGLLSLFMIKTPVVFSDEPISIGVNVANKLDVALAVGPTEVDYSTFEADLRALLAAKSPAVDPNDLYVTAAKAVSASSTSEFTWWAYDHTRPTVTEYGGTANVNDSSHTYIDTAISNTTTATYSHMNEVKGLWSPDNITVNATATNALGINNMPGFYYEGALPANFRLGTPDSTNPDLAYSGQLGGSSPQTRRLRHPYNGIISHMVESDNGATMDFYGYPHDSYKDFRFLPNDQATKKVFEFAIQEDVAYDALDGVGFFFNTSITGSYASKNQTMSGYLLFLSYATATSGTEEMGKGRYMAIYKFQNVNTYRFHQSMNSTTATATTSYTIANYNEGGGNKFVEVARSPIYTKTDKYRRIKLEVYPTYVKAYYNGSPSNANVLVTPIAEGETPVNWTNGITGEQIPLDPAYVTSFGFGPMASYIQHTCARPTHLALQNLSMSVDKAMELKETVEKPIWHENTLRYLVNLNEHTITDFESNAVIGSLLTRLRNDDIYYIGWGSTVNAVASAEFLRMHTLKGTVVDIESLAALETDPDWIALSPEMKTYYLDNVIRVANPKLTYAQQMQAIADKIYERYWRSNTEDRVLVTDQVVLTVSGAEQTGSADLEYPSGKWKVVHRLDHTDSPNSDMEDPFDNDEGIHDKSGQFMSDLDITFNLPGYYDIYYRGQYLKTVTAHRAPVANFSVNINDGNPIFTSTSVDPDDETSGIVRETWSYLDIGVDETPHAGKPSTLIPGHLYLVTIEVEDKYGVVDSIAKQVHYLEDIEDEDPENILPPYSEFDLSPLKVLKGVGSQDIYITNTSNDPQGLPITSTFTLSKGGIAVPFAITEGANDVSSLAAGIYTITLVVNNGVHDSVEFARDFSITVDSIKPTAVISPNTGSFSVNTPVIITFDDTGGSGLKSQRVAITGSASAPGASDSAWSALSGSSSRIVTINTVGTTYIHWEAEDHAGNTNSGTSGAYTLAKQATSVVLSADPATSAIYPAPIQLTATFATADPTGVAFFLVDGNVVGSATIAGGIASFEYIPNGLYMGNVTLSVTYSGNATYNGATDSLAFNIIHNSTAEVTVGAQTNKTYDGEVFVYSGVSVVGTNQYSVTFTGRDGTTYSSTTPPTDAGKYTITVTTTDPGYAVRTGSANFEIFKADQAALTVTGLLASYDIEPGTTVLLGTSGGSTGGAVTYASSDTSVASISGNVLTIHKMGDFTVTATMAGNGNYNAVSSSAFSVGVDDETAPTGKITLGATDWTSFTASAPFTLFYKSAINLSITATDNSGEVVDIKYYVSSTELTATAAKAITAWTSGDALTLSPNSRNIVYAKLTDTSGNVAIINSTGIVIYSDSAQGTATVTHGKYSGNQPATVVLNGNTVAKVMNGGDTLVLGTDYTVSSGNITLLAHFLDGLDVDDYTLTIYYHPMGREYHDIAGNEAPLTTMLDLMIQKAATVINLVVPPTEEGGDVVVTATLPKLGDGGYPTGTVTFLIDGVPMTGSEDIVLVNGVATFVIAGGFAGGEHTIEVVYSGDDNYETKETALRKYAMSAKGSLSTPNTGMSVVESRTGSSSPASTGIFGVVAVTILGLILVVKRRRNRS